MPYRNLSRASIRPGETRRSLAIPTDLLFCTHSIRPYQYGLQLAYLGRTEHHGLNEVLNASSVSLVRSGDCFELLSLPQALRVITVEGWGGKVDSNQFDSIRFTIDRSNFPLSAPLSRMCIVLRRDSETSREGHATRYCCVLQVNARRNDGSHTRRLEKYRCERKFLRSGEVIVFSHDYMCNQLCCYISPNQLPPILVMANFRPKWIYMGFR